MQILMGEGSLQTQPKHTMTPTTKLEDLLSPAQISERGGKPILSPNKTEEISTIARYATEHNLSIEITGAGTPAWLPDRGVGHYEPAAAAERR